MRFRVDWLALTLSALCVVGCDAHFPAAPVNRDELSRAGRPGIYYALPKTVLDTRIPVEYATYQGGELREVETCALRYRLDPKDQSDCAVKATPAPQLRVKPADVATRSVADYDHVYRVNPQLSWWYSQQHEFSNDPLGYLKSASSVTSNEAASAVGAVVKSLVGLAPVLASKQIDFDGAQAKVNFVDGLSPTPTRTPPRFSLACSRAGAELVDLLALSIDSMFKLDEPPRVITRSDAECIDRALRAKAKEMAKAASQYRDALAEERHRGTPQGYAAVVSEQRTRHLTSLQAELAALRVRLRIDARETTVSTVLAVTNALEPRVDGTLVGSTTEVDTDGNVPCMTPSATMSPELARACVLDHRAISATARSGASAGDDASLVDNFRAAGRRRVVVRARPVDLDLIRAGESAGPTQGKEGLGYRYRLAERGRVTVEMLEFDAAAYCKTNTYRCQCDAVAKSCSVRPDTPPTETDCFSNYKFCTGTLLFENALPIAQFGPIVALPSKFSGKDATVKLELIETGAMSKITIGQKARDAAPLTGVLDAIASEKAKRDEAKQKASEAEQKAPLERAQQQNSLLAEDIKQRKAQRCLALLADLPVNAPWPDECKP